MADRQISAADRAMHDALIDLVTDHPTDCPICATAAATAGEEPPVSDKTYTESELHDAVQAAVDKAVAEATAPLTAKITEFESSTAAAERDAEKADLQGKLDTAEARASAAEKQVADVTAFLADAQAQDEAKAAADARRDARVEEVRQIGVFPEDTLKDAERQAAWAAYEDDVWTAKVAEFKEIASAHKIEPGKATTTEPKEVAGKGKDDEPLGGSPVTAALDDPNVSATSKILRTDPHKVLQVI